MRYPFRLSADLQYLAALYQWNDDDKAEVRTAFTESPKMVQFFIVLAAAHRAGYEQCAANGFVRLHTWCLEKGIGDPFSSIFNLMALDALAIEPIKIPV